MPLPINVYLHKRLRDHNLAKVAAVIGCRRQLLHSWVYEGRVPSLKHGEVLCRLARYLGIALDVLIRGAHESRLEVVPEVEDKAA
jgi:hypothetical protein